MEQAQGHVLHAGDVALVLSVHTADDPHDGGRHTLARLNVLQVNISEATYRLVVGSQLSVDGRTALRAPDSSDGQPTTDNRQLFHFTPRGKVQAKGKGEMEMYFVTLT